MFHLFLYIAVSGTTRDTFLSWTCISFYAVWLVLVGRFSKWSFIGKESCRGESLYLLYIPTHPLRAERNVGWGDHDGHRLCTLLITVHHVHVSSSRDMSSFSSKARSTLFTRLNRLYEPDKILEISGNCEKKAKMEWNEICYTSLLPPHYIKPSISTLSMQLLVPKGVKNPDRFTMARSGSGLRSPGSTHLY